MTGRVENEKQSVKAKKEKKKKKFTCQIMTQMKQKQDIKERKTIDYETYSGKFDLCLWCFCV